MKYIKNVYAVIELLLGCGLTIFGILNKDSILATLGCTLMIYGKLDLKD